MTCQEMLKKKETLEKERGVSKLKIPEAELAEIAEESGEKQ